MSTLGSGESKLETVIGYLLIVGVITCLLLEAVGVIIFYRSYGHLNIVLEDKALFVRGRDFFSFLAKQLFSQEYRRDSALWFMTLGIVALILTPYIRVVASVLYFAWRNDKKYTLITAFVLAVLTASLAMH